MPVTITFHKISEKKPEYNQDIIYLNPTSSFGYSGFEPRECQVDYCWFGINKDGLFDGSQIYYSPDDTTAPENYKLGIRFNGYVPDEDWLWIDVEDYWKSFD